MILSREKFGRKGEGIEKKKKKTKKTKKTKKKKKKNTVRGIPAWSPTAVLTTLVSI